jgi:OOP family OmpA-OmpF porin
MNFKLILIISTFLAFLHSQSVYAQQSSITYTFNDDLNAIDNEGPPLTVMGKRGEIVEEKLPQLGNSSERVYRFEANNGLQFDNKKTNGFLNASFTVELYFKLDSLKSWKRIIDFKNRKSDNGCYIFNGKLNFFNLDTGKKAPIKEGQYMHYVFSRDAETKVIRLFVDGESKLEFVDSEDDGVLDEDQVLNLFYDDLVVNHEASAGTVAFIRLYDRVMTPVFVRKRFRDLAIPEKLPAVTEINPEPTPATPEIVAPPVHPTSPSLVRVKGKVYNGDNLTPIQGAKMTVTQPHTDSVIARTATVDGNYQFLLEPRQNYRITAHKPGYQSKSQTIHTGKAQGEVTSLFSMSLENYSSPLAVLPFSQSQDAIESTTQQLLNSLVDRLKKEEELHIRVEGHTDNVGDDVKNRELAEKRAEIVKSYLTSQGIAANRIETKGFGSVRPIAPNSSEASRQRNRRVEVWGVPIKR